MEKELQVLQEMLTFTPEKREVKLSLYRLNQKWEDQYNNLRAYQKTHHFKIPKEKQEAHRHKVRQLIATGCVLRFLNQELARKPQAIPQHHETAQKIFTALRALKITESAYSQEID